MFGLRELDTNEIDCVSGGEGAGQHDSKLGIGTDIGNTQTITAPLPSDVQVAGSGLAGIGAGVYYGSEAAEALSAAAEAGVVGAEVGAFAGPIGAGIGLIAAAGFTYVAYEYGPAIGQSLESIFGSPSSNIAQGPSVDSPNGYYPITAAEGNDFSGNTVDYATVEISGSGGNDVYYTVQFD